jgi:hypothetical protein
VCVCAISKWYWREGATLVRAILLLGWAAPGGRIIGPEKLRQLYDIRRDPPRLVFGEQIGSLLIYLKK